MKRLNFLIVDDSELIIEMSKNALEQFVDCDTASDGDVAVEKFKQRFNSDNPYDVILMDIEMPNMRGIDALKAIRSYEKQNIHNQKKVIIIMVTALYKGNVVIESMLDGDADHFMTKPFERSYLCNILDNLKINHTIVP